MNATCLTPRSIARRENLVEADCLGGGVLLDPETAMAEGGR
jgi:hypothetical protein